jgi:PTH1 family peptidyl-tRNA hydrolase
VGFDAVDRILALGGGRWIAGDAAEVAETEIEGRKVTLMKPLTYMNLSGEPVSGWARAHSIERNEVLVYLDDVAIPLGRIRLRERGSDGGHRGLTSVLSSLGGDDVPRVRIGIKPRSPEGETGELSDFVLAPFTKDERPLVEEVLARVVAATRMIVNEEAGGMRKAMSLFNAAPEADAPGPGKEPSARAEGEHEASPGARASER